MVLICSEAKRLESSTEGVNLNRDENENVKTQEQVDLLKLEDDCKLKRLIKHRF